MVLQGECTLVQDEGETALRPGDCGAFPACDLPGHHYITNIAAEARFLVIGSRMNPEHGTYCDVDLEVDIKDGKASFTHKDGTPYQGERK